jgi:hypothetical protein
MCVDIYKNHPETVPELISKYLSIQYRYVTYTYLGMIGCFTAKLADPDEKVRLTACKVLREIGMENNIKTLDKKLVLSIAERIKDKKVLY